MNEGFQITYTGEEVQELLDKAGTAVQTETDPTVPSWAKAESKPSYSASEVGAVPTTRKVNNKALSADVTLSASDVGALPSDTPLFSGSYNDLTDKPDIPDSLSDLSDDSTHRVVTDTEKSTWSAKSDFSGSYDDLTDKPSIPAAQVQSDWSEADSSKVDFIKNKPSLATVATSGSYSDLSNTPTIPTVPTISTDISSDATSDDKTASPKAVKTFVEGKGYITSAHEVPAGGNAGQVLSKVSATDYDTHWVNQTTTYPSAYSTTAGGTAAKKASCSLFALQTNSYVHILIAISNTSASALTLSINSTTAKPIYINGVASSATNYTLPAGTYIVFYDGTNYYFRTDGKIQGLSGTLVCTSNTSGLIKNDGTIDTTSYGTYSKPSGGIPAADLASGVIPTVPSNIVTGSSQSYTIAVVSSLPASPDADTIYLVTGS